ncbi:MAG: DUF21 domain-containing protein [Bacteroidetes bacterium]|jgi:CBS domain containing-hemolysin-like protein|nr:DUF21 domain-containing protein [Bacteroidota bacterium]
MNLYLLIVLTLLFSAFFSGMEIAFVSSNKLRLELDKKQTTFPSRLLSVYIEKPSHYIATMLVGNNVALVIYGIAMAQLLEPVFMLFLSSDVTLLILQTLISTLIILITAEFIPKTIFSLNPNTLLVFFALPVYIFYILFYPLTHFIIWLSHNFLKTVLKSNVQSSVPGSFFGKIDLNNLLLEANDENESDQENDPEIRLFQNALDFSSVKIRDCMVPRPEIIALDANASLEEAKKKFAETGFSKILIYQETIDDVLGYIHVKDFFKSPTSVKSIIREVSIVPETMSANKLLRKFIQEQKSTAVVVDEFGGISGLVTIEDMIEEIFGEIEDEHDIVDLVEKEISDHEFIFSGRLEIDYINERYNLEIPESDEYDTLAGFIFYHYENLPKMNESILIDKYHFKVLKMSKTRIEIVKLVISEE